MRSPTKAERDDAKVLGELLREFRERQSLSQEAVATQLFGEASRKSDVSKYENGRGFRMKPITVKRFAEYLQIPRGAFPSRYQWAVSGQGTFESLDFGINIRLLGTIVASRSPDVEVVKLSDLRFELYEASSVEPDPDDDEYEVDIRIGFDQVRLTLLSEGITFSGNYMLATTPLEPEEEIKNEYSGSFLMRSAGTSPPNWIIQSKEEGGVLKGGVKATDVCEVCIPSSSPLMAELTAKREALKVRIVDTADSRAPKRLIDEHRDKMCEAVLSRKFQGTFEEYLLHRKEVTCNRPGVSRHAN